MQYNPVITSDGNNGAMIAWTDQRSGDYFDVYAMRVDQYGNIPPANVTENPSLRYLAQNYPNPFNPSTRIEYSLEASSRVSLRIYDCSGRLIRTLVDGCRERGAHSEFWDGRGEDGRSMSSGIYFYHLVAGHYSETKKMILLK
jgi:hypothetical protein